MQMSSHIKQKDEMQDTVPMITTATETTDLAINFSNILHTYTDSKPDITIEKDSQTKIVSHVTPFTAPKFTLCAKSIPAQQVVPS